MSTALTAKEKAFLRKYKVPKAALYNANGAGPSVYRAIMKETNKLIAFNVLKPCRRGHGLRTRVGACPQCDPKQLHFLVRHGGAGTVYVATSGTKKLVKVGVAENDIWTREASLNNEWYGGVRDWRVAWWFAVTHRVGAVELQAHKRLKKYVVDGKTYRGGTVKAGELFSCTAGRAIAALEKAVESITGQKIGQ